MIRTRLITIAALAGILTLLFTSCGPSVETVPDADNPGKEIPVSFSTGGHLLDLTCNGNEIWAGMDNGVVRCDLNTGEMELFTTEDGLGDNVVRKITQDSSGNIWCTGYTEGVSMYNGTEWQHFSVDDGLISDDTITIAADSVGGVWISAYWGVSYYDGKTWESYTSTDPDGMFLGGENPNNPDATYIEDIDIGAADQILIDSRGTAWFSHRGRGVTIYKDREWEVIPDIGSNVITEYDNGDVWLAGSMQLSRYDGSGFETFPITPYDEIIPRPFLQDMIFDRDGNVWLAAYGGGVAKFDGSDWTYYGETSFQETDIRLLFTDNDDTVYAATKENIFVYDGSVWGVLSGMPGGEIRDAVKDRFGNIWIGYLNRTIQRLILVD